MNQENQLHDKLLLNIPEHVLILVLWETVEKNLGVDTSGPKAFTSVVSKLQLVSSAAFRALVDQLKGLLLLKEPSQDVKIFGGKVVELCRRITGTGAG
jgi:hypothetical protein